MPYVDADPSARFLGTTLGYGLNWQTPEGVGTGVLKLGPPPLWDPDWTMHNWAWCMLNLLPLWMPTDSRGGENLVIGGAEGRRELPIYRDQASHALTMAVAGLADPDGHPYDHEWQGLEQNFALLADLAGQTWDGTLTMPSGEIRSARVQVLSIRPGANVKSVTRATMNVVLPSGLFVPTGS